jgi:hypothetical protein
LDLLPNVIANAAWQMDRFDYSPEKLYQKEEEDAP